VLEDDPVGRLKVYVYELPTKYNKKMVGTARPAWSAQRGTQKQLGLGKRAQDVTRGVDGRRTVFVTGEDRFLGRDRSQLAPNAGELYSSMILITS